MVSGCDVFDYQVPSVPGHLCEMRPIAFGGCFGWLHASRAPLGRDTAVILCSGLGRDFSIAYRPFRILANQLGGSGYPTLRFDYLGAGDSCDPEEPTCLAVWQRSIHLAIDWMQANTQARQIVLVGLRFGGALATLAAATRKEVTGLVLLEPVLRGKSYVAQLSVEARFRGNAVAGGSLGLVVDELHLSGDATRHLAQVDLRQVPLGSGRAIAIFSHTDTPVLGACAQTWSGAGNMVVCGSFLGLEALLRPSHLTDEAAADFTPILSWLHMAVSGHQTGSNFLSRVSGVTRLQPAGCIEVPLHFGPGGRLFGMLCRPEADGVSQPIIIIGNSGGDPHHGYARFSVELARRLARIGISSLRMDFAGLGDSVCPSEAGVAEGVTQVFETDRNPDISAAIELLTRLGYDDFALYGLCSGAYHALCGALADRRVGTVLLINLPWFSLRFERPGPASFARRSMAELSRRHVRTFLLFAEGDVGLKPLEQHFGLGGAELCNSPDTLVSISPGLDHDLTGRAMREEAADRMIEFLCQGQPVQDSDADNPLQYDSIQNRQNIAAHLQ